MFEPHEDRRTAPPPTTSRIGAVLGFVIGFVVGWLAWFTLVLPRIQGTPSTDNPTGDPADWLYYGSLILCVIVALFVVSVIGEWIGSRRRKSAAQS